MNARTGTSAAWAVAALRSDPDAPFAAMLEIADRCNEVCVHCYQVQGQKGEMDTAQVQRVMDELAQMGVLFLTLSGGEVTLRKDFLELVAYARKLRFSVKVYTNGLTMTEKLALDLAALAVQEVQISLYSRHAATHDWVTGVPGSFEKTVNAARRLVAAGVRTVLKSPLMRFNADEYDSYIQFVTQLGCDFMFDTTIHGREDGERSPETLGVTDEQYLKLHADPRLYGETSVGEAVALDARPCGACNNSVHIEANGELRPCSMLNIATGNALRDGVRSAWNENEDAVTIRQLRWRDIHGCRDCDLRAYCHRCYADAQAQRGDALGPYPSACREARLTYENRHGTKPQITVPLGRDPETGPYRHDSDHAFAAVEDRTTDADLAFAASHSWARRPPEAKPAGDAHPGTLVQLRRPGKPVRVERIPDAAERPADAPDGASS